MYANVEGRCPTNEPGLYIPPGHYTRAMLDKEARIAARSHAKDNGGGRPVGIAWEVAACPYPNCVALIVSYYCNRPNGACGRYALSVAL